MAHLTRADGSNVRCYAPGDGHLSYALEYDGKARPYDITDDEAQALCPDGWEVYKDGPYHRARPQTMTELDALKQASIAADEQALIAAQKAREAWLTYQAAHNKEWKPVT